MRVIDITVNAHRVQVGFDDGYLLLFHFSNSQTLPLVCVELKWGNDLVSDYTYDRTALRAPTFQVMRNGATSDQLSSYISAAVRHIEDQVTSGTASPIAQAAWDLIHPGVPQLQRSPGITPPSNSG